MSVNLLSNYPEWQERIRQAIKLAPLPLDYSPQIIEIFDQHGLLAGSIWGIPYQCLRTPLQGTNFLAWLVDGELVVFIADGQTILNRIQGHQVLLSSLNSRHQVG